MRGLKISPPSKPSKGRGQARPTRQASAGRQKPPAAAGKQKKPPAAAGKHTSAAPVPQEPDQDYAAGYSRGYERERREAVEASAGYREGRKSGYDEGFAKGRYAGGNGLLDSQLAEFEILPDIPLEQVIAAGIEHYRSRLIRLMPPIQLSDRIICALDERAPLSVIRLNERELLAMAQDAGPPEATEGGERLPDPAVRAGLIESLKRATIVGIPKRRVSCGLPLFFALLRELRLDYRRMMLTDSTADCHLYLSGYLPRIIAGRRVLLIGGKSPEMAETLRDNGVEIVNTVSPASGVEDIDRVMEEVGRCDFDLAFVSSGIYSIILTERIASEMAKVALDWDGPGIPAGKEEAGML